MIFSIVRTFVRRPQSTVAASTANRVAFTLTNTERVARSYSTILTRQSTHIGNNGSVFPSRSFATRPASRPKAHTGRTTTTPRKKALPAAGAATTGDATRTKKPKAIPSASGDKSGKAKPKVKAKSKAKAKPKAKPKPKPKPKPKSKPKPRARKVLTAEEKASKKSKAVVAKLKESVLVAPKKLPDTAWLVINSEFIKGKNVTVASVSKEASAKYRSLSPEELEHYNHIASQNKAHNVAARKAWLESHSPEEIYRANKARIGLSQRTKRARPRKFKDDRIVKGPRNVYCFFTKDRYASGDFKGIKVAESSVLIAREFKGLTDSEKKKYQDAADQDSLRYKREVKAVYHRDLAPSSKAAHAA